MFKDQIYKGSQEAQNLLSSKVKRKWKIAQASDCGEKNTVPQTRFGVDDKGSWREFIWTDYSLRHRAATYYVGSGCFVIHLWRLNARERTGLIQWIVIHFYGKSTNAKSAISHKSLTIRMIIPMYVSYWENLHLYFGWNHLILTRFRDFRDFDDAFFSR